VTGSKLRASSNNLLFCRRLITNLARRRSNTRPARPATPKTIPDRTLFCKKPVGGGPATELLDGEVLPAIAVTVCDVDVTEEGDSEDDGEMVGFGKEKEVDSVVELDVEALEDAEVERLTGDEVDWET